VVRISERESAYAMFHIMTTIATKRPQRYKGRDGSCETYGLRMR